MPTDERPNRKSKSIIFEFSDEFSQDINSLEHKKLGKAKGRVESFIEKEVNSYDFNPDHERHEAPEYKIIPVRTELL